MPSSAMNMKSIQASLTDAFATTRSQVEVLRSTTTASPYASPKGMTRSLSRARIKRASSLMRVQRASGGMSATS